MKSRISKHSSVQPMVSDAETVAKTRSLKFRTVLTACAIVALAIVIPGPASAQNYSVIHNFTGGAGGAAPLAGLVIDHAGNLYGTTFAGGDGFCRNDYGSGCGIVFQLKPSNGILTTLFQFAGGNDAAGPAAPLLIGPNGALYGGTLAGGGGNCSFFQVPGCGTVFRLVPPASSPRNTQDRWVDSVLHSFQQSGDGTSPTGTLAMDRSGNLYGAAGGGGSDFKGRVFELTYSNGVWSESVLHDFLGGSDGSSPGGGVTLDAAGNVYGTAQSGGNANNGVVFQLLASSHWAENTLYEFTGGSDGSSPEAGVIFDSSGNLYGATSLGGSGGGGTAFELSSGSWTFNLLSSFTGAAFCGPAGNLTFDQAGNLYGTTSCDGADGHGSVFKLTPSMGTWIYTSLYDFTGGSDGGSPNGNLVFDSQGNLYGTASCGGSTGTCPSGDGVVFKLTP
jgi:uncharacterized repeat protein (TIGR03803 family)